jgi:hypothetical protein
MNAFHWNSLTRVQAQYPSMLVAAAIELVFAIIIIIIIIFTLPAQAGLWAA